MPQIQFTCDLCDKSVEVEIEFTFVSGSYDRDPQEFFFDADEWMQEHGWRRLDNAPDPCEIACPEHTEVDPGDRPTPEQVQYARSWGYDL